MVAAAAALERAVRLIVIVWCWWSCSMFVSVLLCGSVDRGQTAMRNARICMIIYMPADNWRFLFFVLFLQSRLCGMEIFLYFFLSLYAVRLSWVYICNAHIYSEYIMSLRPWRWMRRDLIQFNWLTDRLYTERLTHHIVEETEYIGQLNSSSMACCLMTQK